jgi:hypothetical protein
VAYLGVAVVRPPPFGVISGAGIIGGYVICAIAGFLCGSHGKKKVKRSEKLLKERSSKIFRWEFYVVKQFGCPLPKFLNTPMDTIMGPPLPSLFPGSPASRYHPVNPDGENFLIN